jgi:hypothetical protein
MMMKTLLQIACFLEYIPHISSYEMIRFGGAGIYFWWQAGAATFLREECNIRNAQLLGASAGSIAASLLLSNASFYDAAKIAISQVEEKGLWTSKSGLAGVWGPMVRDFLYQLVPEDLSDEDLARIHICITPSSLLKGTQIVSDFHDKNDLIGAVMASAHIPLFMDGKLWTKYKGKRYIDGSFWSFVTRRRSPLPKQFRYLDDSQVLNIDYHADKRFMASLQSKNMVKLIKPEGLYEMMDYGYSYMSKHVGDMLLPCAC